MRTTIWVPSDRKQLGKNLFFGMQRIKFSRWGLKWFTKVLKPDCAWKLKYFDWLWPLARLPFIHPHVHLSFVLDAFTISVNSCPFKYPSCLSSVSCYRPQHFSTSFFFLQTTEFLLISKTSIWDVLCLKFISDAYRHYSGHKVNLLKSYPLFSPETLAHLKNTYFLIFHMT